MQVSNDMICCVVLLLLMWVRPPNYFFSPTTLSYYIIFLEFDIRKEAAWAISNATSGGNHQQIKFLVQQGCIRPLCDLLGVNDPKIVTIALEGLENILKTGEEEAKATGTQNQMAVFVSEAEGLNKIEDLQQHSNNDIYEKCIKILETYFGVEEEEEMANLAPQMEGDQFGFGMDQSQQQQAPGTFDFSNSQ
jgi:importin subunit alpha-1